MAKRIDYRAEVYRTAGPKQKEPTYQFGRRTFYQNPQPPGEHTHNVDSNKATENNNNE
ncbi:hypothetical protein [Hahella ganghwensis]|uniref:hypothetical protein n=1 Tax=Hahella ganghwensis TaxID=286420 RepID=UPI0003670163|nr:hypothetical protein [Hahella ganghwensis]